MRACTVGKTRINSLWFSSEKGSRLIYFNMEDNLLHAISLLQYVQFHVVTQISLYALSGLVNRVIVDIKLKTIEKSKNVSPQSSRLQEFPTVIKGLTGKS